VVADVLELPEIVEDDEPVAETNYALKLIEAISAAQPAVEAVEPTYSAVPQAHTARPVHRAARAYMQAPVADTDDAVVAAAPAAAALDRAPAVARPLAHAPATAPLASAPVPASHAPELDEPAAAEDFADFADFDLDSTQPQTPKGIQGFIAALDKLPPIRLPIGPAIPWRIGLPALVALLVVMAVMYRPSGNSEPVGVKLPAQETYAVQQESPLFAKETTQPQQPAQPIGVSEPAATNVDVLDIGLKFIAVLALAYGSLLALKKFGPGGTGSLKGSNNSGVRVVSSIALAPNRSVHVLRTPDGKSLLLGATPNQVNLIADLGELSEDALTAQGSSFFDVLSAKLPK
jgi:flagellar biogenesis protein FliO